MSIKKITFFLHELERHDEDEGKEKCFGFLHFFVNERITKTRFYSFFSTALMHKQEEKNYVRERLTTSNPSCIVSIYDTKSQ